MSNNKGLSTIIAETLKEINKEIRKPRELTQDEKEQGWTINEAGNLSVGRVWSEIL